MIVVIHSYKGGTGKTLISANLATLFAIKGNKTCLLDMDFRAPSLNSLFKTDQPKYWLNDYLNGACEPEETLQNYCSEELDKERLFVCLANLSTEAIREMTSKNRKWEMQALSKLLSLKDSLVNRLGFDTLVIDTSPGIQYSSLNAIVAADIALVVTTLETSDLEGTKRMLHDLYQNFEKKTAVIVNKVPFDLLQSQRTEKVQNDFNPFRLVFNEVIACSCDIPLSENPCFFACRKRHHQFSRTLEKIVRELPSVKRNDCSSTDPDMPCFSLLTVPK